MPRIFCGSSSVYAFSKIKFGLLMHEQKSRVRCAKQKSAYKNIPDSHFPLPTLQFSQSASIQRTRRKGKSSRGPTGERQREPREAEREEREGGEGGKERDRERRGGDGARQWRLGFRLEPPPAASRAKIREAARTVPLRNARGGLRRWGRSRSGRR